MTTPWDQRFDRPEYLFGTQPAVFLRDHAGLIPPGARTLCVADGEGRNGVWLAQQGCKVTSFDYAQKGLDKAEDLAQQAGVALDLHLCSIEDWDWSQQFDLVVACFIQFAGPDLRAQIFDGLMRSLAPGGRLMLHGYTPEQVALGTGGPPSTENMYTAQMLAEAFAPLNILRLAHYEKLLDEGVAHSGHSALVDLIADKPA